MNVLKASGLGRVKVWVKWVGKKTENIKPFLLFGSKSVCVWLVRGVRAKDLKRVFRAGGKIETRS